MQVYQVSYSNYGDANRIGFSVKANSAKAAKVVAEKCLIKMFKSFSFTIYHIAKQKEF